MATLNCRFCGYRLKKEHQGNKCPYCGKSNALIEEENAEEIVIEA